MSTVLNWIKTNIYTVIFLAVMIAAPVAMWIVAGKMNASVKAEVEARASKISELGRYEKTAIKLNNPVPSNEPVSATIAVNRRFLDRFQEVIGAIREDAERVRQEILKINHKDRGVLLPRLFPAPPRELIETLPRRMSQVVLSAYDELLESVGAGSPPTSEQMYEDLAIVKERLTTQNLKSSTGALDQEEVDWLTEQLTATRLSYYAEAAKELSLYASLETFDLADEAVVPGRAEGAEMSRMFDWQWRYWIVQDILNALARANEHYDSVVEAPVKRVERILILDRPGEMPAAAVGSGGGGGGAGFGAAGAKSGRRGRGKSDAGGGKSGVRVNPSREVPLNYGQSFTGRTTNPLFDVRRVEVVLVVDNARIPDVFDALARENFMTVTNLRLETLDLFEPIREGYYYGAAPVSRLIIELETIWARRWTSQFMPAELKQTLGIPMEAPKS